MIRYLVISAIIVFGSTALVAAWMYRDFIRIKIASVNVPVPPKPGRLQTMAPRTPLPLTLTAPWILSELPACLEQLSDTTGSHGYVMAHLPTGAVAQASGQRLVYGNCTVIVGSDEAWVTRDEDRFYIPPHVTFYRAPGTLAVLERNGPGAELRVYQPSSESTP